MSYSDILAVKHLGDKGYRNPLLQQNKALVKSAGGVLYLDARKATGIGKTTAVNTPFVDLSGKGNNATLTNFAGTTSSGYDISDPIRPFLRFDGTDDYGALVNTPSIDITSAPLAVFATFRVPSTISAHGHLITKALDNGTLTAQFNVIIYTDGAIGVRLEGAERNYCANAIIKDAFINIGFIWDGTNAKVYRNGQVIDTSGAYSGTLTGGKPNIRIGTYYTSGYLKHDLATLTIYSGAKATEANILKAEKALSKAYIGG